MSREKQDTTSSEPLSDVDSELSELESLSEKSEKKFQTAPKQSVLGEAKPIPPEELTSAEDVLRSIDNQVDEKKAKALAEIADLNHGNFFQRYGTPDNTGHKTHEKLEWYLTAIPNSDPRKALMELYVAQLEKFAREVLQYQEINKDKSPLEIAEFIRVKAIEDKIPQVASLFSNVSADLRKSYPIELNKIDAAFLEASKSPGADKDTINSDILLITQLLNKYSAVLESVIKKTDASATDYNNLDKMLTDFKALSNAINEVPLISPTLFSVQKNVQLNDEQKAIDKLLIDVRIAHHLELSPMPLAKEGVYQNQREQAAQKALSAMVNYFDKNAKSLSGKPLTDIMKNVMTLLEHAKQPPKLQDVQKIIKTLENVSKQANLNDEQKDMIKPLLERCREYEKAGQEMLAKETVTHAPAKEVQQTKSSGFLATIFKGVRDLFSSSDKQSESKISTRRNSLVQVFKVLTPPGSTGQETKAQVEKNRAAEVSLEQEVKELYGASLPSEKVKTSTGQLSPQATPQAEPPRLRR